MKIYAKQVAPEDQESPLRYGEWPENIYLLENRNFRGHGSKRIDNIINNMDDASYELKRLLRGELADLVKKYTFKDILNDFLKNENGREYSRAERLKWRKLLLIFDYGAIRGNEAAAAALELITDKKYNFATIRGCCQSDWQEIIYPAEYGDEWLKNFEIEYFNLGEEWNVNEGAPDSKESYYFYTHAWSNEGKRAEIAAVAGVDPSDVVLYVFDGWSRSARYKEI